MVRRIRVDVGPFYRKGKKIDGYSYLRKDTGAPGRTPKSKWWFKPKRKTGWSKDETRSVRRARLIAATDKRMTMRARYVQAGRMAQQLANVTTDKDTERRARSDAMYFFRKVD